MLIKLVGIIFTLGLGSIATGWLELIARCGVFVGRPWSNFLFNLLLYEEGSEVLVLVMPVVLIRLMGPTSCHSLFWQGAVGGVENRSFCFSVWAFSGDFGCTSFCGGLYQILAGSRVW
jgi:hypothetical protein